MAVIEVNTAANPAFIDTSAFSGSSIIGLEGAYATGTVAADQTVLISAAKGGPAIFKANAAATGSLLKVQDSSANNILSLADNAAVQFKSPSTDAVNVEPFVIDTINSITVASNRYLLSVYNGGVAKFLLDSGGDVTVPTGAGIFSFGASRGVAVDYASMDAVIYGNRGIAPAVDYVSNVGNASLRWWTSCQYFVDHKLGAQLTAAATITPTSGLHHVTGATTIDNIATTNLLASSNPMLMIVADGGTITWSAAGNILKAGTVAQNNMQLFVYDSSAAKWIPAA